MRSIVTLMDVVQKSTESCNPKLKPDKAFTYIDVAAIDNKQKSITGAKEVFGIDAPSRARKILRAGDVIVSTVRPNLNAVALVPNFFDGQIGSTGLCVLRASRDKVLPEYLYFFVCSSRFVDSLTKLVSGALYPAVTDAQVLGQKLPLPPIKEQQHIVDILSRAEGIVRLRREAQEKANAIIPALFLDMFGDAKSNPKGWKTAPLSDVAKVQGGLQVTTARAKLPLETSYLRVANVYRSRLDLKEIKSIRLTEAEFNRTRLEFGDLLFVEGHGNPQEVGRVAMWDGSIPLCTHQNHLIRARLQSEIILPIYACWLLNSMSGRQSLSRAGKTTSGLSTISTQNVKDAKMMLPPIAIQTRFVDRCSAVSSIAAQQATALTKAETTFQSLLSHAFGVDLAAIRSTEEVAVV